jgi:hypothetical protein
MIGGWRGRPGLDLEEGWYHVLNRGIERRSIFKSSKCYSHFVELLRSKPGGAPPRIRSKARGALKVRSAVPALQKKKPSSPAEKLPL